MLPSERLFMRLIKGSFAGLVLAGILAMMPAAAFAHGGGGGGGHGGGGGGHGFGGGGGGHGFGGGGGGHAFGGGGGHGFGGGHAFGRFTGRGFSPGFSGMRGFSTSRFSGRGDHGRFGDRGFHGRDRDFHGRRFHDFDGGFVDFGFTDFGYPDYSYYPYSYYNGNGYLSVERAVQEELAELGYYHGPVDGTIGPETQRAIRWFQSVDKIPVTGRIDSATLRALQIS
jgi:Putative peptidoglycan binding domain